MLLEYFFGNQVKVVKATHLRSYMEFEQQFVFHKDIADSLIKEVLWTMQKYSVKEIKKQYSKKITAPLDKVYYPLTKEKCIKFYD